MLPSKSLRFFVLDTKLSNLCRGPLSRTLTIHEAWKNTSFQIQPKFPTQRDSLLQIQPFPSSTAEGDRLTTTASLHAIYKNNFANWSMNSSAVPSASLSLSSMSSSRRSPFLLSVCATSFFLRARQQVHRDSLLNVPHCKCLLEALYNVTSLVPSAFPIMQSLYEWGNVIGLVAIMHINQGQTLLGM